MDFGVNLAGIADWATARPLTNAIGSARELLAYYINAEGRPVSDPKYPFELDALGYPKVLPEGVTAGTYLFWAMADKYPAGVYNVRWEGDGALEFSNVEVLDQAPGRATIRKPAADEFGIWVTITKTKPNNHLRNLSVTWEGHDASQVFVPEFLESLAPYRVLRMMDWANTNYFESKELRWDGRVKVGQFAYGFNGGMPLEWQILLCNLTGKDGWFCVPHTADDDYVCQMAQMLSQELNPGLKAYVEYSNEAWNDKFKQAGYCFERGAERFGKQVGSPGDRFYGWRAAQVMKIFGAAFERRKADLVRVFATQAAWLGRERLAFAGMPGQPADFFDAYAIAPYVGASIGSELHYATVQSWFSDPDGGIGKGFRQMRDGSLLATADDPLGGSLRDVARQIRHHAAVCKRRGLRFISYEGGSHLAGEKNIPNDEKFVKLCIRANANPRMRQIYSRLFDICHLGGLELFNHFNHVEEPSKWGCWAVQRYLGDLNYPKYRALLEWQARQTA
jgi:hypothetical protein